MLGGGCVPDGDAAAKPVQASRATTAMNFLMTRPTFPAPRLRVRRLAPTLTDVCFRRDPQPASSLHQVSTASPNPVAKNVGKNVPAPAARVECLTAIPPGD